MTEDPRRVAFIKALIAAAWADGELGSREIRTISEYLRRFEISPQEFEQIKPLLSDPLSVDEASSLLSSQLGMFDTQEEKGTLAAAIKDLLLPDDDLSVEEERMLSALRSDGDNSSANVFVARMRSLWSSNPPRRRKTLTSEQQHLAEGFLRKRLLEYFRRLLTIERARAGNIIEPQISDAELLQIVILAGLLTSVATADNSFCPEEEEELLRLLTATPVLTEPDLRILVKAYRDPSLLDLDLALLVEEFAKTASPDELSGLIDCLFLVAAADGKLMRSELTLIHQIVTRLGFSTTVYNDALERCKQRMISGWN
ncbi:MAG: TerB family tellurite resistance protein [Deltaproteobacteria bacterium]|nr:TerB family tellurite resistance protein [Deltaproteobacteria bacterium]